MTDDAGSWEWVDGEIVPETGSALAVSSSTVALAPIVTPDEAKAAMTQYMELCEAILTDDDYQPFTQYDPKTRTKTTKRFKKKSAVKKLQTFFGVSVTTPESFRDDLGDGHFGFRVRAIATCKGGRVVEAWGACSTQEERFDLTLKPNETPSELAERQRKALARAYHDVLSTAETRATNRAVMNAIGVGGGEVTADEMRGAAREQRPAPPRNPVPRQTAQGGASVINSRSAEGGASTTSAQTPDRTLDDDETRKRMMRRIFALIGEFAEYSDDGARLRDDQKRHIVLERLYARASFNDLTIAQLDDFERRVRAQLEKAKGASTE